MFTKSKQSPTPIVIVVLEFPSSTLVSHCVTAADINSVHDVTIWVRFVDTADT